MAISKIVQNSLDTTSISLGPKISSVQVANSTYVVKDDTAVNTGGGYIVITGSGFTSNSQIIIGSNTACSVTFISATQLRAQVPSATPGSYPVYVVTGDGGTAIRVNALTYSDSPTWVTTSPLASQVADNFISIQLSATGANTYVLQTGSTLPSGVSLAANGLLSGTVTGINDDTTYNFTVEAVDAEAQESPKALSVSISVADPYYYLTTMYLNGDGTNGANNNVFRDSSTNNYTITRNGNPTQGSFSPFSPAGFGAYFDGSDDSYSIPESADFRFGTGDFTIEAWLWIETTSNSQLAFHHNGSGGSFIVTGSTNVLPNRWNHCAITRTGTTVRFWINGVQDTGGAKTIGSTIYNNSDPLYIGRGADHSAGSGRDICHCGEVGGGANKWFWYLASGGTGFFKGYMSNFRLSNSVRYTTTFTPSTIDLTNDANTKLLTLNSNRPLDLSSSARVVTPIGSVRTLNFSPFKPTAAYSAATHVGSAYFDGTGDGLTLPGLWADNANRTFEAWIYPTTFASQRLLFYTNGSNADFLLDDSGELRIHAASSNFKDTNGTVQLNAWNHVALVQTPSSRDAYINGVKQTFNNVNGSPDTVAWSAGSGDITIAKEGTRPSFIGYMSSIRLSTTARYSDTFSVPTAPFSNDASTAALLNFTNSGIIDSSTKNVIETVGTASVNTSVIKYGTGSISIPGSNSHLFAISSLNDVFNIKNASQSFTFEAWIYPTSINSSGPEDYRFTSIVSKGVVYLSFGFTSTGVLRFMVYDGNSNYINSASSVITTNTWQHVAVSSDAGTVRLFKNGTIVASGTLILPSSAMTEAPKIGHGDISKASDQFIGFMDDIRYTDGYARYTANTSAPTGAFPTR